MIRHLQFLTRFELHDTRAHREVGRPHERPPTEQRVNDGYFCTGLMSFSIIAEYLSYASITPFVLCTSSITFMTVNDTPPSFPGADRPTLLFPNAVLYSQTAAVILYHAVSPTHCFYLDLNSQGSSVGRSHLVLWAIENR